MMRPLPLIASGDPLPRIRIDPADATVQNDTCVALTMLRRYDEAIAACNMALRLQPALILARNDLVRAQTELLPAVGAPAAP